MIPDPISDWLTMVSLDVRADVARVILSEVWRAHRACAINNGGNASNVALRIASSGSRNMVSALTAAMGTLGGAHGPISAARELFYRSSTKPAYVPGLKVPGFGNSFHKSDFDPEWKALAEYLMHECPEAWAPVGAWSDALKLAEKAHIPNAAAITAVAAEVVGWPRGAEAVLLIQPRIGVWAAIFMDETRSGTFLQ